MLSPTRALALAAAAALTGCFTVDGTIRADGSGTIEMEYIPGARATTDSETARFSSAHVTVHEVAPRAVGAFLKASFDDVTKLATAEGFDGVSVTRVRKRGQERLRITLRNHSPTEITEEKRPGPRITITLPGPVVAGNRGAEVAGNRVTWRIPLREYAREPLVTLRVRYRLT